MKERQINDEREGSVKEVRQSEIVSKREMAKRRVKIRVMEKDIAE